MKSSEKTPITYIETKEQKRLNEAREARVPGRNGGPISANGSGDSTRRLQPGRKCVGLLQS